jgi:hypothetical protein
MVRLALDVSLQVIFIKMHGRAVCTGTMHSADLVYSIFF